MEPLAGASGVLVAHVEARTSIDHRIPPGRGGYAYLIAGEAAAASELLLVDTAV
jgi:hypothetical protein